VARNIPCLTELENLLTENSKKTSRVTVMLEPVMGVGGVLIPPPRWRTRFNHLVKEHKAILICDEVQTGFGRLGTKLFGFQKHGYTPDILCLGKGIAGGYPLAAVLMTEDVANASTNLLHFSTFGGHPISIAAATETLKLVSDEKLLQEVEENGQWLIQELKKVFASDPRVIDVRGEGYFIGIEVNNATESVSFLEKAYQNGALIGIGGLAKEVIRLEPALIFSKKDCQKLVEILATC
jgi:4-aminobutyrate aminotransferase-like enzyme